MARRSHLMAQGDSEGLGMLGTRQTFDPLNGQAYIETTVRARKPTDLFYYDIQAMCRKANQGTQSTGAPSLMDMAMRKAIAEISQDRSNVTSEVFIGFPWTLACRMWREVEKHSYTDLPVMARLSLWRAFAAAYPDEHIFQYHSASEIRPLFHVEEYLDNLTSLNCHWLTCLTLDLTILRRSDLMKLPSMKNLVALDLSQKFLVEGHVSFEDSTIRNWGRNVQEAGGFDNLRVLVVRDCPHVTIKSFNFLCDIPNLALFGVLGCQISKFDEPHANESGWTSKDDDKVFDDICRANNLAHTWDAGLTATYKRSRTVQPLDPNSEEIPLVHFRLGSTPPSLLFSYGIKPLLFFRHIGSASPRQFDLPLRQENAVPPATKKRKIRESMSRDIIETLKEFFMQDPDAEKQKPRPRASYGPS